MTNDRQPGRKSPFGEYISTNEQVRRLSTYRPLIRSTLFEVSVIVLEFDFLCNVAVLRYSINKDLKRALAARETCNICHGIPKHTWRSTDLTLVALAVLLECC